LLYNYIIYLATNHGLITIKEKNINKPIYLNIKSILVNGFLTDTNGIKHLSYDQNNLECNVDIISYSTNIPKMMYELSGAKNQGGITENQHVSFQNLAIGNYTLTLSLYSKEYNVKSIVIKFSIIPAYWQTVWFKSLCILAILISCFIIVRIAFRFYKNKEDKKNEANKLITEYKLIALKAQINPHFMSNCLTAIQHLILSNKVDEANQYLAKFSLLVRQVLNFSSKPLVSLREELEITELNIELEQLRFENKFLFEIELHENINLKNIYVPPLLLQPITENAIWHGLLPLKKLRNGKLILKINIVDDLLYPKVANRFE
jgi:sensor histidine kinase YesM